MTSAGVGVEVPIATESDVVRVRQLVRATALTSGLGLVDLTKVVTAASELARNALVYGGGGIAVVTPVDDGRRRGVRAVFTDTGPGIPDTEVALRDGWSSGGGLGLGLSGARRLVDEFELTTSVSAGTRVTITKWRR